MNIQKFSTVIGFTLSITLGNLTSAQAEQQPWLIAAFDDEFRAGVSFIRGDIEEIESTTNRGDKLSNQGDNAQACRVYDRSKKTTLRLAEYVHYWNNRVKGFETHPEYQNYTDLTKRGNTAVQNFLGRLKSRCNFGK